MTAPTAVGNADGSWNRSVGLLQQPVQSRPQMASPAIAATAGEASMIYVRLHSPVHQEGTAFTEGYSVKFNGELIVKGSRNAECDAARVLAARGLTGKLTVLDGKTGKARTGHR